MPGVALVWSSSLLIRGHSVSTVRQKLHLSPELELGTTVSIYQAHEDVPTVQRASSLAATGTHRARLRPPRRSTGVTSRQRDTPSSGSPSHRASCRPLTNCGTGTARLASRRASGRIRSVDHTEFVLGSAVPHEHDLILGHYSVHTSRARFAMPRPTFRRSGRASFKRAVCRLTSHCRGRSPFSFGCLGHQRPHQEHSSESHE
jgi:hypothetical protein